MITHPLPDAVLEGDRLHHHQHAAQRPLGLVRAVRPQTMRPGRDADGAAQAVQIRCWSVCARVCACVLANDKSVLHRTAAPIPGVMVCWARVIMYAADGRLLYAIG